ncbi:enoyl-CoA hydratase [Burkholderia multivorans]|uniref:enoyl-CoA hydratase n=1 Tax=Burkholderia multivorans TaxID=87883 RepID=UPI0019CF6985|nr:enoyl-CoA hydratase [Burkholderia multivorans]MBN6731256.1 enoyl-CoA hydratase [Burkholderia multivorans]MBN6733474.1 enoyl-CoA hydratase [Burkholderia multivorans]MBN7130388.1 enoyl-CoA hydratase [Burkholderia multivorans]MBN8165070.1 enoyl-CoA hydratase [Burkholderia multivorans]MBN8170859.1 enoyl-CoA hydratase [Burkholderia multivorans]
MDILTQQENGVLGIMLNRPQQRNALTGTMYDAMTRALDHAEHCSDVHVVLFGSSGGTFCAGNDVADFVNAPPLDHDSPVVQFLQRMSTAQKPLIAAVRGPAVGIGTTLLLHCDLVYATDSASFCLPFVRLGLCAEAGSSLLLPQLAGYQRAAEKLLLGEPFDVREAVAMGLVNRVVAEFDLDTFVRVQAAKLAALPPESVRISKALMKQANAQQTQRQIELEGEQFRRLLKSTEAQDALRTFLGKKRPQA